MFLTSDSMLLIDNLPKDLQVQARIPGTFYYAWACAHGKELGSFRRRVKKAFTALEVLGA